jgi:NADPH-dependent 2,4-dienoyl-CoA reductase/sulfur reductase-like enzyme/uncharacterized protein YcbX/nitrite reductase/ring-hydroxylating ferredoxin subunit
MTKAITGRAVGLYRYPVSSLSGERLDKMWLEPTGAEGDRCHGLFDRETGIHIYPARDARWNRAPLLHSRLSHGRLEISADGDNWHSDNEAATLALLAKTFGRPVDLCAYDETTKPRYKVAPLHLLSLQSLASLRARLPDSILDERRFRPNILVDLPDGSDEIPEYALLGQEFAIGNVRLRGTTPCGRCGFTTLEIGELPSDPSVLRTLLRNYERNFGIYCEIVTPGELTLGSRLVAESASPSIDPVVIVGAGQAGAMTARALRRFGYGGIIKLYGAERHAPYERPPLSKRIAARQDAQNLAVLSPAQAEELDVALRLDTTVAVIDPVRRSIETVDGTVASFRTLVLATGGIARRLPEIDRGFGRVHVLRTIEDADRLALSVKADSKLAVFGGGWIGMELAAAAREAGACVTLFARTERLAPRILPPPVSDAVEALHRNAGVSLHLGTEPRFRETADGVTCIYGAESLTVDHLIVAIGMIANDGLARRAGLACVDGILVDRHGATERAGIYAVGDVSRQPYGRVESWQNANLQAERAARHILQIPDPSDEPLHFWSDQFGRRLQIVGLPRPDAPILSQEDGRFWEFGSFAIGLDAPERIHRFARNLKSTPLNVSAGEKPTSVPAVAGVEHLLCRSAELAEGEVKRVIHPVAGALAVTRQNGRVYVTSDDCPHAEASLATGFVADGRIVCPLHFAEFELDDGTPHHAPDGCGRLAVYKASEREGQVLVNLPG